MKTPVVVKCQQFENSGSEEIEPRGSKCRQLYAHGNEKEKSLDKFESEGKEEVIGYVPLSFVIFSQKESNRSTDMGKRTRSLNYLV